MNTEPGREDGRGLASSQLMQRRGRPARVHRCQFCDVQVRPKRLPFIPLCEECLRLALLEMAFSRWCEANQRALRGE